MDHGRGRERAEGSLREAVRAYDEERTSGIASTLVNLSETEFLNQVLVHAGIGDPPTHVAHTKVKASLRAELAECGVSVGGEMVAFCLEV